MNWDKFEQVITRALETELSTLRECIRDPEVGTSERTAFQQDLRDVKEILDSLSGAKPQTLPWPVPSGSKIGFRTLKEATEYLLQQVCEDVVLEQFTHCRAIDEVNRTLQDARVTKRRGLLKYSFGADDRDEKDPRFDFYWSVRTEILQKVLLRTADGLVHFSSIEQQ